MKHWLPPRWRTPTVLIAAALVALVIGGASHGWKTVPEVLPIPLLVGIFLFVMARRESDYGASLRRQLDERQVLVQLKIQALVGRVLSVAVAVAYLVAVSVRRTIWPFAVLLGLMAIAYVTARLVYGEHSGDDED